MDPEVMGGKACLRGMRVNVGMIVGAMAAGRTIQQMLTDFPISKRRIFLKRSPSLRAPHKDTRSGSRLDEPAASDREAWPQRGT
jgi:hypothetical protein